MKDNNLNTADMPLVSIIIPFYNVGKYARGCMESLLLQDYTKCEFICVDDGSTDDTLSILNEYSKDERVKIVHKENGGLSDARNYGLSLASGDYISIIDGDDFIHPQYITNLVKATEGQLDRIVISPLRVVKYTETLDIKAGWSNEVTYYTLNKHDVSEKILYNELSVSACAKLVPRKAYDTIKFPVGKVSEEVATIGLLIRMFDSFSVVNQPMYGYVMRSGSIGHKKTVPYKDIQDRIDAMKSLESVLKKEFDFKKDKSLASAMKYRWGLRFVDIATMYDNVEDDKESASKMKKYATSWLRKNIKTIFKNSRAPFKQRVRIWLFTYFPGIYLMLYSLHQKLKYNV